MQLLLSKHIEQFSTSLQAFISVSDLLNTFTDEIASNPLETLFTFKLELYASLEKTLIFLKGTYDKYSSIVSLYSLSIKSKLIFGLVFITTSSFFSSFLIGFSYFFSLQPVNTNNNDNTINTIFIIYPHL